MRRYAVQTSLLVLGLGCSLTSCGQTGTAEVGSAPAKVAHKVQVSDTGQFTAERRKPSPRRPSPEPTPRCQGDQLRLAVAVSGSTMSQPFGDISITNSGVKACLLTGYPRIAVAGHRGFPDQPAPAVPVAIKVHHGIYERVDSGPHQLLVPPRRQAFFSIGTGDAYDGPLFTLTRLTVTLLGIRSPKVLTLGLLANGPLGRKIPVGITAINRSPHP
jgi:hypothetical protein